MYESMSVPQQFHKFIDIDYSFNIVDFSYIRSVKVENDKYTASFNRLEVPCYIFPPSILFNIHIQDKIEQILILSTVNQNLYTAPDLLRQARQTGPRKLKYLTIYRAYESLTKPNERDLVFSSIRHSLSHSPSSLHKPNVVKTLNELFGGLEIYLGEFRHRKIVFINYWKLLKEVDRLIKQEIEVLLPRAKNLTSTLKVIL
jgi:hypothetical protein